MSNSRPRITSLTTRGSGRYDQQVRRIRAKYRLRSDQLVAAVASQVASIRVEGVGAGLKALLRLPNWVDWSPVSRPPAR